MSTYTYAEYLSLGLAHSYYRGGVCRDWQVTPATTTLNLLGSHQYRWKAQDQGAGGLVFGETGGNGFLTTLPENAHLVFFLHLTQPRFLQVTDPGQCPAALPLRWENVPNTDVLQLATGTVPTELQGVYAEAQRLGAKGIVVLHNVSGNLLAGRKFKLNFTAKSSHWTYFVVLRGFNGGGLEVRDALAGVQFPEVTAAVQGTGEEYARERRYLASLGAQAPGARLAVFRSAAPLTWQEAARPKIELIYHGQDSEVLQPHLPAPADTDWMVVAATRKPLFEITHSS